LGSVKHVACEAKTRAPVRANNIVDLVSLLAPSAKILSLEAGGNARLSANNEALITALAGRTLHGRAKFASKGRIRTVASPYEATLASPIVKGMPLRVGLRLLSPTELTSSLLGSL